MSALEATSAAGPADDETSAAPESGASSGGSRRWLGWALLLVVVVIALGAISIRVTERGRFALPYSTYGAGPDGTRALYTVLAGEGFHVVPWTEDVGRLSPEGALVILGGCDHRGMRAMSRPERERLTAWIDHGGVLIVAGAGGFVWPEIGASLRMRSLTDCLEDPGLIALARAAEEEEAEPDAGTPLPPPASPPGAAPDDVANGADKPEVLLPDPDAAMDALDEGIPLAEPMWGVPALPPLTGLPLIGMRAAGAIELAPGADARVLASTGGKMGIVEIRRGEGRVVVLASASLFQNRDLVEHGGAQVMVRLLRHYLAERGTPDAPVRFDEYHVGAGERRSMARYFTQAGVMPLIVQCLFGLAIWVLVRSRRFGAVRAPAARPRSSTGAFVGGLSGLLRASKDRKGALQILVRSAIATIATAHHQNEHEAGALAKALEERGRKDAAEAVRSIVTVGERTLSSAGDLARATRDLDQAVERAVRRES